MASGPYDLHAAIRHAADVISRASVCFLVLGEEFAAECGSVAALPDLSGLGVPGLSKKRVFSPALLDDEPTAFYGFWGHVYTEECIKRLDHDLLQRLQTWNRHLFSKDNASGAEFDAEWNTHGDPLQRMGIRTVRGVESDADALPAPGPVFALDTSVSAAWLACGLGRHEVYQPRGSVALWQCARPCDAALHPLPQLQLPIAHMRLLMFADSEADGEPDAASALDAAGGDDRTPAPATAAAAAPASDDPTSVPAPEAAPAPAPEAAVPDSVPPTVAAATRSESVAVRLPVASGAVPMGPLTTRRVLPASLTCARCAGLLRPQVRLGEADGAWLHADSQLRRLLRWQEAAVSLCRRGGAHRLVIVEIGAAPGDHLARHWSETMLSDTFDAGATLVRISASDATNPHNQPFTVSVQGPLGPVLRELDEHLLQALG